MDSKLFLQAISKFLLGVFLLFALLFFPAGSLRYGNGWLFLLLLFLPMFIAGLIMMRRSPALLRKRLQAKEREAEQRQVIAWSGLMFITCFVLAGLNFRFQWLHMPSWSVWIAVLVFLLAYLLYAEVLRENAYLSRTIEVQEGQVLVDSGLYGIVRHPMYTSTLFLFLSIPFVLGSPLSFLPMLMYFPLIVRRIQNEEAVLREGLDGYAEYCSRVKYRLVPYLW